MPNKKQVISQTRHNKSSDNKARKDATRQQKQNPAVPASILIFANVSALENFDQLNSLVSHVIKQHGHPDESVKRNVNKKTNTITYEMVEKTLCLDIAHHVNSAFKHYHPEMEMHNPKDNEFYRIIINFND